MATKSKIGTAKTVRALTLWRGVTTKALKSMPLDLSVRQTAVLTTVYLLPPPHSVKSLAEELDISKPAICRAVDVLEDAGLIRRRQDKQDKRNVLILRTAKGLSYLSDLAEIIVSASKAAA